MTPIACPYNHRKRKAGPKDTLHILHTPATLTAFSQPPHPTNNSQPHKHTKQAKMFKKIKNAGKKKEVTIEEKSNKSSLEPANEKDPRHAKLDSSEKKERKRSKERERGDKGELYFDDIIICVLFIVLCGCWRGRSFDLYDGDVC